MICKKCGYDELIPNGDWLKCPHCGAEYFNTKIDFSSISPSHSDEKKAEPVNRSSTAEGSFSLNVTDKKVKAEQKPAPKAEVTEAIKETADGPAQKTEEPVQIKAETNEKNPKRAKKAKVKKEKKPQSKLKEAIDFLTPIVLAVIVALVLKTFIFANAIVPSGSMISTINKGDRIIASRLSYIKEDPQRYDIIMFHFPDDESKIYVKRIIGMPGETITIVDGITYATKADGTIYETNQEFVTLEKPLGDYGPYYIPFKGEKITTNGEYCFAENGMTVGRIEFLEMYCKQDENGDYIVAENCYFCIGDNRNNSLDSRTWYNTYVAQNKILGKVKFRYYPSYEQLQ